jgi:DNA-binding MarR family transcriptional regulator
MVRVRSTSVKPLSAAEVREADVDPLFLVWIVSRSTEELLTSTLAPVGLTGDEFAIYSILNASPGITPTELSRWMAAPPTTVSSYVNRMQARGHVTRRPHPSDRRSYRIELTAAGKGAHGSAVALFTPVRTQIIRALGDEEGPVREALLRLRGVIDRVRDDEQSTARAEVGVEVVRNPGKVALNDVSPT